MSSIFSIYIPRINNTVTDEYINYVFCQERIGSVVRVDFTSVGQKPGFVEKTDDVIKCAFVYLFLSVCKLMQYMNYLDTILIQ